MRLNGVYERRRRRPARAAARAYLCLEDLLHEVLLQSLIGVVDKKLFVGVLLKKLEAVNIQNLQRKQTEKERKKGEEREGREQT